MYEAVSNLARGSQWSQFLGVLEEGRYCIEESLGNYSCQARGAVKTSGLVAVLGPGWYHQGCDHIHGIMDPKQMWKCLTVTVARLRDEKSKKRLKKYKCEKHMRCFMVFHYWWCKNATRNIVKRFFCFILLWDLYYGITECPELEGMHKGHWVQPLALHSIFPKSHVKCLRILPKGFVNCQAGPVTTALGSLF